MTKMFNEMVKMSKWNRERSLTKGTVKGLVHTLNGLKDFCESLLTKNHDIVLLGNYLTDPLEKEFGKQRQRSGRAYFLSLQQVVEKLNKKRLHRNRSYMKM